MPRLPVHERQAVQAVQAQAPEQVQIQVPQKSQVQAPARVLPLRAWAAEWVAQLVVPVQGAPPERGIARS